MFSSFSIAGYVTGARILQYLIKKYHMYEEVCWNCNVKFLGIKDAPLCPTCSKANEEWWDSLTEKEKDKYMLKISDGISKIKGAKLNSGE